MNRDISRSTSKNSGIIRSRFDWAASDPSTAVIQAVAVACNRDPLEMGAIYERVDPDALDAMFERNRRLVDTGDLAVSFSYERHEVTVTSDGEVIVAPQ